MQGVFERKDELQRSSLLTIEGNDAALHLYNKLGYKNVDGEMTFLGDVKAPQNAIEHTTVDKNANISEEAFYQSGSERMRIDYSKEIHLKSKSGDIDLTFTPLFNRHDHINLLIIESNQNQVFGRFNGKIKANNQEFEFNNYLGFLEKVINKY